MTGAADKRRQSRDRECLHRQLLEHHRVRRLVHGRGPLLHAELVEMMRTAFGLSRGMAEAAIARAVAAGDVDSWIAEAPASNDDGGGPDPDAVLAAVAEDVAALEEARRAAGEASED